MTHTLQAQCGNSQALLRWCISGPSVGSGCSSGDAVFRHIRECFCCVISRCNAAGQKQQKFALNSADKVYLELRDLSFAAVGPKLSERAKSLQTDYKGSKGSERSLAELKDFAAQLKSLPNITRHINLAEAINRVISRQNFRDRVTVEQSLLDGHSIDGCCETIEACLSHCCLLHTLHKLG